MKAEISSTRAFSGDETGRFDNLRNFSLCDIDDGFSDVYVGCDFVQPDAIDGDHGAHIFLAGED